MKTVLKIIGSVLGLIVLGIVFLFVKAALTPAAPRNYTQTVKTGGEIERTYLTNGDKSVSLFRQTAEEDFKQYEVWYPSELKDRDQRYPLIVMLNGTGIKASKYKAQFEHFASWGFIVIGTEEEESWDAAAADSSLAFMLEANEDPASIFCQKVDTGNIGAMGHSQGGAGVFNAVTACPHSDLYKTAVPISPTGEERTVSLGWNYDLSAVRIPVLLLAGTKGDFEMNMVLPEEAMIDMYQKISAPKVMARRLDCEHGEMLYSADGYTTAWFMWQLQNDAYAAKAFTGDSPEIMTNSLYTEQAADLAN